MKLKQFVDVLNLFLALNPEKGDLNVMLETQTEYEKFNSLDSDDSNFVLSSYENY